ncbi:MAG: dienelactone hydrolase family protein [Gammaproteobacteria bacterium]|nr:dienelactone hydrolase family protein [Gammaproteobacteria bacterium]
MQTATIDYQHGGITFEAFYALAENDRTLLPVVLIFHTGNGRNQFVCDKAKALAKLGYLGVALDVYGKGVFAESVEEQLALVTPLIQDRVTLRQRLLLGMETAKTLPQADSNNIAAMGYCFGGLCALDLARAGAKLNGAASFHGLLSAPENLANAEIHGKILAMHGHDDLLVPPEQVLAFETEMTQANVDWQVHVYGQTRHAFTNPKSNFERGNIYNAAADKRSWLTLQSFLTEVFAE